MKRIILSVVLTVLACSCGYSEVALGPGDSVQLNDNGELIVNSKPYTVKNFATDFKNDTKQAFFKNIMVGYYYDLMETKPLHAGKFGVSTQLLAYSVFSLDPIALYTPRKAGEVVEFGMSLNYRPIGNRVIDSSYTIKTQAKKRVLDKIYAGSFFSHNFTTGKFGAGFTVGLVF